MERKKEGGGSWKKIKGREGVKETENDRGERESEMMMMVLTMTDA